MSLQLNLAISQSTMHFRSEHHILAVKSTFRYEFLRTLDEFVNISAIICQLLDGSPYRSRFFQVNIQFAQFVKVHNISIVCIASSLNLVNLLLKGKNNDLGEISENIYNTSLVGDGGR